MFHILKMKANFEKEPKFGNESSFWNPLLLLALVIWFHPSWSWAAIECTAVQIQVAMSKWLINQFISVQHSRKQALIAYCHNIYTVGKLLEITCEKCQEILPSAVHFRRHSIDKHQKYNHTTKNKESFCCDECGKTFNVRISILLRDCCPKFATGLNMRIGIVQKV